MIDKDKDSIGGDNGDIDDEINISGDDTGRRLRSKSTPKKNR